MILLADAEKNRFFLIPDVESLGSGSLELSAPDGTKVQADPERAAAFEVPEAVAKAWADKHMAAMGDELEAVRLQMQEALTHIRALPGQLGVLRGRDLDDVASFEELRATTKEMLDSLPPETRRRPELRHVEQLLENLPKPEQIGRAHV